MRKGKITFAWSPEEESELNLPVKPTVKPVAKTTTKPAFDVSQIRDRVMQMEMGEEMVLDGEALESLEAEEAQEEEDTTEALAQALRIKQAKEARAKSRLQEFFPESSEDFLPFAQDHRLKRDFEAAEEEFTAHQSSRLIREDLLNDQDDSSAIEGFTMLPGLSRRLLERDLKSTEFYDSELRELHAEDSNDDGDEGSSWQATQARKGIEKGWRSAAGGAYDADEFLAKHSRLALQFTPPKPLDPTIPVDTLLTEEQSKLTALKAELTAIEQNCAKMRLDVEGYDFSRFDTEAEKARLGELRSLAAFTAKWSAFLTEREAELEALSSQCQTDNALVLDAWEHFFDDVEAEELLDLPGACVRLRGEEEALVQIVGFFCKYHRLKVKLVAGVTEEEALETSGLQSIIDSLSPTAQKLIKEKYLL